ETYDKVGHMEDETITVTTLEPPVYVDSVLTSEPKLSAGMIPVKWNGSNWIRTTQYDSEWYDYSKKQWANIVLGDADFDGDILNEDKPYSMLVWIPRYAYQITTNYHTNSTNGGNIEIVFIDTANKNKEKTKTYSETYPDATT